MKVKGIKSVDMKIVMRGHGVVNWNGVTTVAGEDGKEIDNHLMPKLRGYTNLTGKVKENGYKFKKQARDLDFKETPLYISQNCFRHYLFQENSIDFHFADNKNITDLIPTFGGLVRGYVVPSSTLKRTSALLVEDMVDQLGNGNFEQFANCADTELDSKTGEYQRSSTSIFSKTTFGDTHYVGYASISIENLQFISLDRKFDRCAYSCNPEQAKELAEKIEVELRKLDTSGNRNPKVEFHENYVRVGGVFPEGEAGLLLNDDAIDILVEETIKRISDLIIRTGKAYAITDSVLVDYNDGKAMRIKSDETSISEMKHTNYAVYYKAVDEGDADENSN